ncbi:MAG: VanW family protein [Faecousia sp.]
MQRPKEAIFISSYLTERKSGNNSKARQRLVLTICCAAIGITLAALIILLLLPSKATEPETPLQDGQEISESRIPDFLPNQIISDGVSISGIPVGGMTEQQAMDAVRLAVSDVLEKEDMVLSVGDSDRTLRLTPDKTKVHWDIEKAVSEALNSGKEAISLELALDKDYVTDQLEQFFDSLGGVYVPSGYWLDGDSPDLERQTGPCQTLVLNTGSAGFPVDLQEVYDQIASAYEREEFQVSIDSLGERKEPKNLDLEQVFNQVSIAAQNPTIDRESLEVIPGKMGYGFDLEKAAALLETAKQGDSVRIQMEFTEPSISEADAWFQDTLGYCKTEYTDNENRNENLRLACSMLDGKILQPGETLSYNETLGKRTTEAGYKPAPAYSGTELVDEVGGGICQVSSTLYLSSLFAELTIVERKNHGYPADYIPLGLDATVNWGTTDLKIRNDYDLPVKILAEVSDGYVKVRIMGVEQRDYYVKMEYRVDDHPSYAAAYRCRYDRETDEEISRTLDHTSIYLEEVWCWPGYAESATDEPITADNP